MAGARSHRALRATVWSWYVFYFFISLRAKLLRYWRRGGMTWKRCYQREGGGSAGRAGGPLCGRVGPARQPLPPLLAPYPSLALSFRKLPTLRSSPSWSDIWSWGRRCGSCLPGCSRGRAALVLSRWFGFSREARNLGFMNVILRCKCREEIENS